MSPVNGPVHPLTSYISQFLWLHGDEYIVPVSPSCLGAEPGYVSRKPNNNRYLLLCLSRPPTTLGAFALCLAWQQCEVNRMNKTYLNQSPLPWEMSSCQYSLMGKHRAGPKGRTVYRAALTKMQPCNWFLIYHKSTSSGLLYLKWCLLTHSATTVSKHMVFCKYSTVIFM